MMERFWQHGARAASATSLCFALTASLTSTHANAFDIAGSQTAPDVVAYGDSLTYGANSTPGVGSWPIQLHAISGLTVLNTGIPGQTSKGIAERAGASPLMLSSVDHTIHAAGPTAVRMDHYDIFQGIHSIDGTLAGIHGRIWKTDNSPVVYFERSVVGTAVSLPRAGSFVADGVATGAGKGASSPTAAHSVAVVWACRNDIAYGLSAEGCLQNVQSLTRLFSSHKQHFIVLAALNGEGEGRGTPKYMTMQAINRGMKAAYPNNFIDIREVLIAHAQASDHEDAAADIVPRSLRLKDGVADPQHLGDAGYAIVARSVFHFISTHHW